MACHYKTKHEDESVELQKHFKVIHFPLLHVTMILRRLYGSFMFDGVMFEGRVDNYVDRVVNAIDQSEATKYKLFDEITAIFTSDFFERKS